MKRWAIIIGVTSILLLGIYLQQKSNMEDQLEVIVPPNPVAQVEQSLSNPSPAVKSAPEQAEATKPFHVPPSPEIERHIKALGPDVLVLIEKNKLMNYFQHLAPQFSEDESGRDLLVMMTFLEWHKRAGTPEAQVFETKLKALESNPVDSMLAMGVGLQRMGHLFPAEKQYLLQFVEQLDVPEDEKREILVAEAKRPFDDRELSGQARFTPSIAISVLGHLYAGKEKNLYPIVGDIVAAHKERPEIQKIILHEYGRIDRARSRQLYKELGLAK